MRPFEAFRPVTTAGTVGGRRSFNIRAGKNGALAALMNLLAACSGLLRLPAPAMRRGLALLAGEAFILVR